MKKLLAVVLAVLMCTAALLTFVSAEDVAGTEYKLGTVGTDNVNGAFKVYLIQRATPGTWDGFNPSADFIYADMKPATVEGGAYVDKFHNSEKNTDMVTSLNASDAGIETWVRPGACWVFEFKAPVAGTYTVSADVDGIFGAAAFMSVGNNDLTKYKQFEHAKPDTLSYTVDLEAGETLNIGFSRAYGATTAGACDPHSDQVVHKATNFKVTLDAVSAGGTEPEDPTPSAVVYDFIEAFKSKNLEGSCFSPVMIHHVHGNIGHHYTWYDGTDASKKNAATGGALEGYRNYNSDEGAYNDVTLFNGNVWWYSPNKMDNVICFTAPVDGVYTYDFDTAGIAGWGGAAHSSMDFYVQSGETMLHEAHYDKGTAESETFAKWTGTITLKAGETIYFANSSGADGNSAGDNCVLNKLQVTLVEEIKPEAPKTGDALVAVLALVAVAGTALVISKKH